MSPTRNSFSGLKFSIEASVVVAAAYGARRDRPPGAPLGAGPEAAPEGPVAARPPPRPPAATVTTASTTAPAAATPSGTSQRGLIRTPGPGRGRAVGWARAAHVQWSSASASHGPVHPLRPADGPIGFAHRGARSERRRTRSRPSPWPWSWAPAAWRATPGSPPTAQVVLDHDGVTGPPWRRRPIAAQLAGGAPVPHSVAGRVVPRPWGPTSSCRSTSMTRPPLQPILNAADRAAARHRLWLVPRGPAAAGGLAKPGRRGPVGRVDGGRRA